MPPITTIEDLRVLAKKRVPKALFDYVDGGSYDENTLRANRSAFMEVTLRQRALTDTSKRDISTTMLGEKVSMPVALSPTGMTGLLHGNGEMLAAQAAEKFGTKFCQSTLSINTVEEVAGAVKNPIWFQLYVFKDRGFARQMIDRAKAAKVSALFVTVDLAYRGQRHADIKNGLTVPPRLTMRNAWDLTTKVGWWSSLIGKRHSFGNLDTYLGEGNAVKQGGWASRNSDQSFNWKDLEWIRDQWGGKIVLKGINDVEDAKLAAAQGVDGIVVSNHGGRQLDCTTGTMTTLPYITDAVGDQLEVLLDGGVRSGHDAFKAIALGAKGVMIGRPFLYGLAAMGGAGVSSALEVIREGFDNCMILCGVNKVSEISRKHLFVPPPKN